MKHVFRLHGLPIEILSDRGPQFTSAVWKDFCRLLGARVALSSGFHPQTNGQTERMNQELETALRCLCSANPTSWSAQLAWVEYAHNSHASSSTGLSPFEISLGYQPPLFPSDQLQAAVPSVRSHLTRCRKIWSDTVAALRRASDSQARFANRRRRPAPQYTPGQKVWLSTRDIRLKNLNRKLAPRFIGPYEIEKVLSSSAVRLKLPSSLKIHPVFHVSLLNRYALVPFVHSPTPLHPPVLLMVTLSIPLGGYWTSAAGAGGFSTSLSGRGTVLRTALGFLVHFFQIPLWLGSLRPPVWLVLPCRQVAAVEGGVMLGSVFLCVLL